MTGCVFISNQGSGLDGKGHLAAFARGLRKGNRGEKDPGMVQPGYSSEALKMCKLYG